MTAISPSLGLRFVTDSRIGNPSLFSVAHFIGYVLSFSFILNVKGFRLEFSLGVSFGSYGGVTASLIDSAKAAPDANGMVWFMLCLEVSAVAASLPRFDSLYNRGSEIYFLSSSAFSFVFHMEDSVDFAVFKLTWDFIFTLFRRHIFPCCIPFFSLAFLFIILAPSSVIVATHKPGVTNHILLPPPLRYAPCIFRGFRSYFPCRLAL